LPGETEPRRTSYPEYIASQMEAARRAETPQQRAHCLAGAISANGLWIRAQEIGFIPEELPMSVISRTAEAIEKSRAFQKLMADENSRKLAESGSLHEIIDRLTEKAEELESAEPDRTAAETIHGIQVKVQTKNASPRDFARLVAVHRLAVRPVRERLPDGTVRTVARPDLDAVVNGKRLREETERVLNDDDFRYLMKHEHPENLRINALRLRGVGFERYQDRAVQLRRQEREKNAEQEKKRAGAARASPER